MITKKHCEELKEKKLVSGLIKIENYLDPMLEAGQRTFDYSNLLSRSDLTNQLYETVFVQIKIKYEAGGWTVRKTHGDCRDPYINIVFS